MSGSFEELPLFGTPDVPADVHWPQLPDRPWWRRYAPEPRDACTYCILAMRADPQAHGHRPVWHRIGVDGAVLLLCQAHADLFAPEVGHKSG